MINFINKNAGIIVLVAIVIAIIYGFFGNAQQSFGAVTPSTTTGQYATESTGAPLWVLGNAIVGPNSTGATAYTGYISTIGARLTLTSGTSTPCSIVNPLVASLALGNVASATGTIQSFSLTVTAPTSTSMVWAVGTSTTPYATSTGMASVTVAAGAQVTITYDGSSNNNVIKPNEYIVAGSGGTSPVGAGGVIVGGTCQAVIESTN